MKGISAILLASGFSRRFGSNKLLHQMDSGRTMIEQSLEVYLSLLGKELARIYVVIPPDSVALRDILSDRAEFEVVINEYADQGLSQSVVAGVSASLDSSAWLIGLADMPYLRAQTLREVLRQSATDRITQPQFASKAGNPVCIGHDFVDELLALQGDVGAKPLIHLHSDKVIRVDCNDPGIHLDIDRPDDVTS